MKLPSEIPGKGWGMEGKGATVGGQVGEPWERLGGKIEIKRKKCIEVRYA